MTPNINKAIMLSRPLWDPDPDTFVVTEAVKLIDLKRVRLSDFVIVAFDMAIKHGRVTKSQVDIFETVYCEGAKVRAIRKSDESMHEGHPAVAPDGTAMSMYGIAFPGGSGLREGDWNTENVQDHPLFSEWLEDLLKCLTDLPEKSQPDANTPFPSDGEMKAANSQKTNAKIWVHENGTPITVSNLQISGDEFNDYVSSPSSASELAYAAMKYAQARPLASTIEVQDQVRRLQEENRKLWEVNRDMRETLGESTAKWHRLCRQQVKALDMEEDELNRWEVFLKEEKIKIQRA